MRLPAALVASLIVAVLAADVAAVVLHDDATPYDAAQAVNDFREQTGSEPSTGPTAPPRRTPSPSSNTTASATTSSAPASQATQTASAGTATPTPDRPVVAPGVYRYQTSGHEEIDTLGGSRHDYPAESVVTYRRSGCGTESRWQPLQERYSANLACRGTEGAEVRSSTHRSSFYGQTEEQTLVCAPGVVLVPDAPRPGYTTSGSCRSKDTVMALTSRVEELTTLQVAGKRVDVIHVRLNGRLTGSTRGTSQSDEWLTRAGLLVRAVASVATDRDTSTGTVHYTETYELRLESLQPQR
jgi:hypothetical protein